jgi:hypothetical protein
MRAKVFIPTSLIGMAGLLAIFLGHTHQSRMANAAREMKITPKISQIVTDYSVTSSDPKFPSVSAGLPVSSVEEPETHEDYVVRRVSELMDLAMTDDRSSLASILTELSNSDAQIRSAAVTAVVQFKSPDAVPALREVYTHTEDSREKIRLIRAIEFLSGD